jgi:hypothetical protein
MNRLHVGFSRDIKPPLGGYLWIDDEPPKIKNARSFDPFDPKQPRINLLRDMDYRKAVGIVAARRRSRWRSVGLKVRH